MTKPTLLILAAGMGSRYGGIKQLDAFGPNGETIIDYSLFDAIRAGFGKVVFIIREELREDFEKVFGPKLKGKIDYDYAIQGFQSYVPDSLGKAERAKPWGTGHAMLCAWEQTKTPFAVINADDFYGADSFKTMADFLSQNTDEGVHAMIGYHVKNTLSENGTVSRGVCEQDENGFLTSVVERTKILRNEEGKIVFLDEGDPITLGENTPVSMNFWGFMPSAFPKTKEYFEAYAEKNFDAPKAEFYIPTVMSNMMNEGVGKCRVFNTSSDWFGVTYPEDKPEVQASIQKLVSEGKYPEKLW
ncbi:sugar phosphate nucleotidyltransferase [Jiulongibacter sediminis]|uniref:nucleotidyltransferase family protein n=1 Tax=Jiulongibacter sediminis TaxID=1605367 RepID=UPI0026EAB478|nr:sugar phosphate nucleotidyltransferase [Jiulongibacter sediminis]